MARELRGKKDDSPLVFNHATSIFEISGRGVAFGGNWKLPEGMWEPWDMSGHMATINSVEVKIVGIEAFASYRSPDSPYRHNFCIIVSVEDAQKLGWEKK